MAKLLTIGVPVYNGAATLRQALDSLLAQDYSPLEVIISDNNSTDASPTICLEYAEHDPRIRYHRSEENRGAVWNFNRVATLARGTYFMWGAHDDLWDPRFASRCIAALEADPTAVACHTFTQGIGTDGHSIGDLYDSHANDGEDMVERWRLMMERWELHAAIYGVLRTSALNQTRLIQPGLGCDFVFVSELALRGKILQLPEVLSWKRVPDQGTAYRTPDEMLTYLGGSKSRPTLIRMQILRACLRGLAHAKPELKSRLRMIGHTIAVYVRDNHWRADLSQELTDLLGESTLRAILRAVRRRPPMG